MPPKKKVGRKKKKAGGGGNADRNGTLAKSGDPSNNQTSAASNGARNVNTGPPPRVAPPAPAVADDPPFFRRSAYGGYSSDSDDIYTPGRGSGIRHRLTQRIPAQRDVASRRPISSRSRVGPDGLPALLARQNRKKKYVHGDSSSSSDESGGHFDVESIPDPVGRPNQLVENIAGNVLSRDLPALDRQNFVSQSSDDDSDGDGMPHLIIRQNSDSRYVCL